MPTENQTPASGAVVVVTQPSLAPQPQIESESSSDSENQAVVYGQLLEQNRNLAERYETLQQRLAAVESQTLENQSAIQTQLARILEIAETGPEPEPEPETDVETVTPEPEPMPENEQPENEQTPEPEPTRQPPKWAKFLFG